MNKRKCSLMLKLWCICVLNLWRGLYWPIVYVTLLILRCFMLPFCSTQILFGTNISLLTQQIVMLTDNNLIVRSGWNFILQENINIHHWIKSDLLNNSPPDGTSSLFKECFSFFGKVVLQNHTPFLTYSPNNEFHLWRQLGTCVDLFEPPG